LADFIVEENGLMLVLLFLKMVLRVPGDQGGFDVLE